VQQQRPPGGEGPNDGDPTPQAPGQAGPSLPASEQAPPASEEPNQAASGQAAFGQAASGQAAFGQAAFGQPTLDQTALERRSENVRLRRSATLLLMTLVAPGSAQLVAGNKRVGRIALRISIGLLALAVVLGLAGLVHRPWLLTLGTDTNLLLVARVALLLLAVAWIVLLTDAWRLGDPLRLRRQHRMAMVGMNTALCMVTGGALLFSAHLVAVQRDFITSVFTSADASDPHEGRYNVMLLGGDSGADRWGLRPDSISVASIDEDTGRTVIFSLPRNMQNVPFPEGSVMAEQFPDGFDCEDCYLNGVYTWALDHEELWPRRVDDVGLAATTEAVEGITGLDVNYYAMVNLAGFTDLVDAVGGVEIDVEKAIPIGGIGAPIDGYIDPGLQRLDGFEALWYARSRVEDDDYARMGRQKCVMNAMLQQLSPTTVVLKVQDIASAGKRLLETDIPASELDTFIDLALKAKSQPVSSVSFVPPRIQTSDPDYDLVRTMVDDALAKANGTYVRETTAADSTDGSSTAGDSTDGDSTDGPRRERRGPAARNHTDDLASTC
jgi:LCP family protein required for cell wall assembly